MIKFVIGPKRYIKLMSKNWVDFAWVGKGPSPPNIKTQLRKLNKESTEARG